LSRLFTFGCSFTNYRWSTSADCLAPEFDEFYNWGQSGAGNHFIFNSVMEADQRYKFNSNDTVIVCWTNAMREDRYIKDRWQTLGNINTTPLYNPDYIKQHIDERGSLIRDLAMIKAVQILLKSAPGLTWKFLSMCPLREVHCYQETPVIPYPDVFELYNDVVQSILPSYRETVFKDGWKREGDPHPTPVEHLTYLDTVLPGWVTKESTRVIMREESINLNKDPRRTGLSTVARL